LVEREGESTGVTEERFKTYPSLSGGPQSWHGLVHGLAYLLLVLSLLLSYLFLWWRLRRDPLWRGYDL
jgi:hypothetical protein